MHGGPRPRSRFWCFTINNPGEALDPENWEILPTFLIYQLEAGEDRATPHFQGYVAFPRQLRLGQVSRILPRAHLEARRGTHSQAVEYCSKSDTRVDGPWRYGDDSGLSGRQGRRHDLERLREDIIEGASLAEIASNYFTQFMRYHRGIQASRLLLAGPDSSVPRLPPEILVLVGPTGSGKSSWVLRHFPGAYWATILPWFDGYDFVTHKTVVFDDFQGGYPFRGLLRLLDRYPSRVQIKGSSAIFPPQVVVFTSNVHPRAWYSPPRS